MLTLKETFFSFCTTNELEPIKAISIYDVFIKSFMREYLILSKSLLVGDFATIRMSAHKFGGSTGNLLLANFGETTRELSNAALANDSEKCKILIEKLKQMSDQYEIDLERIKKSLQSQK